MAKKKPRPAEPPPGTKCEIRMEATPEEGSFVFRFLGEVSGILVHQKAARRWPCPGLDHCSTADHRCQTRWKGYAAAQYWRDVPWEDWRSCVFEVTAALMDTLGKGEVRGQVWSVCRQLGTHGNREVVGHLIEDLNADRLPPAFNIAPIVCKVYGVLTIEFDVAPLWQQGPPVLPSAGDRPKGIAPPKVEQEAPMTKDQREAIKRLAGRATIPLPGTNGKH